MYYLPKLKEKKIRMVIKKTEDKQYLSGEDCSGS